MEIKDNHTEKELESEVREQSVEQLDHSIDAPKLNDIYLDKPFPIGDKETVLPMQTLAQTCPICSSIAEVNAKSGGTSSFVYALGRVEARFPSLGVEKEFSQAIGRAETKGLTDRQTFYEVLSKPENRYLVRQMCWVLTIEGLDTYILQPRDPYGYDMLVQAVRPAPRLEDIDIIIGSRGPIAPPEMCNGLVAPIVVFDQIYSFDIDALIKEIPRPKGISAKEFAPKAEELFMRIMQMADNAGADDGHRAVNYLAVRYPAIYAVTAECFGRDQSLTGVEVKPSRMSGVRKIVDVVFSYTDRKTDVVDKYFVRVDTSEEFPFLVSKLSVFYDR
jgi:hypothetical protein